MINLICFPHYTAGGLLCDILSDTYSSLGANGGINSIAHSIGKIGDTDTVLTDFNTADFMSVLKEKNLPKDTWVGTHCWPKNLPADQFNKIIVVSTSTSRSKIYRWLRAYHHYFSKEWQSLDLTGMARIDKIRETAKNYVIPFEPIINTPNIVNIEFADIVENTANFRAFVDSSDIDKHLTRWKLINTFLYSADLWNDELVTAFYQAECELLLNRYYVYH